MIADLGDQEGALNGSVDEAVLGIDPAPHEKTHGLTPPRSGGIHIIPLYRNIYGEL